MATSPSQSSALQNQQGSLQGLYNRFRDVLGGVFREVQTVACPLFRKKRYKKAIIRSPSLCMHVKHYHKHVMTATPWLSLDTHAEKTLG